MDLIKVGITHGDYNGVGYEVIVKALADNAVTELYTPVIFGYPELLEKARELAGIEELSFNVVKNASEAQDGKINVVALPGPTPDPHPGNVSKHAGRASVLALDLAVKALNDGDIDVLVTAPISKEAVNDDNFKFAGHTEYLQNKAGKNSSALMILCNDILRVALLTVHLPLSKVPEKVTEENIATAAEKFAATLRRDFGCMRPSIAVLSLNPHAGDGGVIGHEEESVMRPALDDLRKNGLLVFGPYPADGFFGHGSYKKFDGVLAMYHDQGLAPFKTIAASGGVNFTAGLPFVRTSPDHGTAFDIAWQGVADESSMRDAIYMAIDIFRRRSIYDQASANPLKKFVVERPDRSER